MILYFVQLSLIWSVFLIAFYIFYKNQSFHQFNRIYLLLAIVIGVILPFLPVNLFSFIGQSNHNPYQIIYQLDEVIIWGGLFKENPINSFVLYFIITVYLIGVGIKLYQTTSELRFYRSAIRIENKNYQQNNILFSDRYKLPFSFFNTIVLPKSLTKDTKEKELILIHELSHIKYKHCYDLVLLKIVEILFPFHPCLYFIRKELLLIHEYQADSRVTQTSDVEEYANLLIRYTQCGKLNGSLIHSFIHSPIKSRLMMLCKKSSPKQHLYKSFAPFIFLICLFLQGNANSKFLIELSAPNSTIPVVNNTNKSFKIYSEELPQFPGGMEALIEFLSKNIRYPESGKTDNIQGTSLVRFDVYKDGSIRNTNIVGSLGRNFDLELLRVIKLMPNWIPARKDGKKIKSSMTIPVKFQLDQDTIEKR